MPFAPLPTHAVLSLLVITGDAGFGRDLVRLLETRLRDARIHFARTFQAGLDHLAEERAKLVLLDLSLPDCLGLAALTRIRDQGADPAVIILVGQGDEERLLEAMPVGVQDYLLKGTLDGEVLVRSIRYALERKAWQSTVNKAETSRKESNQLLACTLDSMNAAIAIADERGMLVAANAPWKGQGGTSNPFIPPWQDHLDYASFCRRLSALGDGLAEVGQGFLDVLAGDQAKFVLDYQGSADQETRSFGITINRFRVEGDHHLGIAVADITRRVEADRELFKAIAIKNLILENTTLGIAFVRERVFEWANTRMGEIMGRPMVELLGVSTRCLYPDEAAYESMGRSTYPGMARGERTDFTLQLMRGDGSLFWSRMIGRALETNQPGAGSVWIIEDITERVDAEQQRLGLEVQLRQAQKLEAIGQLAAGIAHEINTPTQYIGDNTRFLAGAFEDVFRFMDALEAAYPGGVLPDPLPLLKDEADLTFLRDEIPKAIEQSMEGIDRVSKIVRAMKDFSHPGSDVPVEVDLNRSIESTITVSRNEWKYVADLVLDLDPDLGPVQCFPNEMNQVVLNLVINAAHAIADALEGDGSAKGTITVGTARAGDMVEIRVRDTGTGIPEKVRARIFDPFFTTKTVGRGTGQGLAIVHNAIVERHRGTVSFETELGKGTVFILRIPMGRPVQT